MTNENQNKAALMSLLAVMEIIGPGLNLVMECLGEQHYEGALQSVLGVACVISDLKTISETGESDRAISMERCRNMLVDMEATVAVATAQDNTHVQAAARRMGISLAPEDTGATRRQLYEARGDANLRTDI